MNDILGGDSNRTVTVFTSEGSNCLSLCLWKCRRQSLSALTFRPGTGLEKRQRPLRKLRVSEYGIARFSDARASPSRLGKHRARLLRPMISRSVPLFDSNPMSIDLPLRLIHLNLTTDHRRAFEFISIDPGALLMRTLSGRANVGRATSGATHLVKTHPHHEKSSR